MTLGQVVWPLSGGLLLTFLSRAVHWGLVLLMAVAVAALALALAPRLFGFTTYVVYGGSMGGALPAGSVAMADWRPARAAGPGDIVVVGTDVNGERLPYAHRLESVRVYSGQVIIQTKGDANAAADPEPIILKDTDRVMKVHLRVPLVGYLVHFVQTSLGWVLAVLLPATLLCATILRDIWHPRGLQRRRVRAKRWAG